MSDRTPTRILFYGAGVIGCLYAALLAESGADVTVLARGRRLALLKEIGLLYRRKGCVAKANARIIDTLSAADCYDCVFLTVRADQLHGALSQLKENISPTIVTMVNSLEDYTKWEALCGKGRILPAFPGAGGGWDGNVLDASLTPRMIQPTTFGEIGGTKTQRVLRLKQLLQRAGIPYQMVKDMRLWQFCHLAMVVPLADAYYETTGNPADVYRDRTIMRKTVEALQSNFRRVKKQQGRLCPAKMNLLRVTPACILRRVLPMVYRSSFGNRFMYQHAMKAPKEMAMLHKEFYAAMSMEG